LSHGLDSVLIWYKRVDFINKQLLIFPVHQKAISHWGLVVADVSAKQITCFHSAEKENLDCLTVLKQHLFKLSGKCYSITEEKNIPRQLNSYDCGAFTCLYARLLAANRRLDLSRKDIAPI